MALLVDDDLPFGDNVEDEDEDDKDSNEEHSASGSEEVSQAWKPAAKKPRCATATSAGQGLGFAAIENFICCQPFISFSKDALVGGNQKQEKPYK
jgi:hypothetical protein